MNYMLLITSTHEDEPATEEEGQTRMNAWFEYNRIAEEAGVYVAGEALHGVETAKVADVRTGVVTDGPFAETKEVIGGFYVLDVADEDAAIEWALKMPPYVSVEVRPVMAFG
ncbi:YciI family protein [Euzebya tangerina]|uniref:YciI family protein n=1 Tax=Euzebya tangerina TaxID=591198 RepID=UPI000E30EBB9|nr:YciI family protein [Euzebya tangerina]